MPTPHAPPISRLLLGALLLLAAAPLRADDPPAPPAPEPAAPPSRPAIGVTSALGATLDALRQGDGGPLGEHDFLISLKLTNPSTAPIAIRAGNVLLRSAGGWLSPLAPTGETDMFARNIEIPAGQEQRIELEKPYKVLGPALDVLVVLEASDGWVHATAPLRVPAETRVEPRVEDPVPAPWPLSLGVHHPLEAVPYADGHRSIVVVGQVQLLGAGELTNVQCSLLVGGDAGTTAPITWSGGVEDGVGPGLWPFVQRIDVPEDFAQSTVSLRLKAELDGRPVSASLDLPAQPIEPFLCGGPVLDHWQLANGPAERRLHANLLQLRSRYAWDFVVLKDGQTYEGDVSDNHAYFAYERSIYAVADGEVVDLCDHQPDRSGVSTSLAPCVYTPVNRVVLRHADGTHTAYLHIREKSARNNRIAQGTKVRAGQVIALVGNSGASSEPHLQFFAFRPLAGGGLRPLPVAFRNAFADPKGQTPIVGVPEGGSQVHFLDRGAVPGPRDGGR